MDAYKQWITNLDIFGVSISLRFNNEKTSKTFFGAIFTILLSIFVMAMFWYLILEIIFHKNPITYVETKILDYHPNITLDKKTMQIAIGLGDISNIGYNFKNEYFKLKAQLKYYDFSNPLEQVDSTIDLILEKCQEKHFPNVKINTFKNLMDNYLCLTEQNITVGGFWDGYNVTYLSLTASYCNNETSEVTCAEISEIDDFFEQKYNLF